MENAVEIHGLCKSFGPFGLKDVSFDIPRGYVVGLIGENGAGKTTLIKCLAGANVPDSGSIRIAGEERAPGPGEVGVVFDDCRFPEQMNGVQVGRLMRGVFPRWDQSRYEGLMASFGIDLGKRIKDYSRGMRMKIQVAVALSHHPDILLMDEATAGMDPAARDGFLDIVMGYMQDESRSVLMSSHITSDLERIADYIVFIHDGRVVLSDTKDAIMESYGIVKGRESQVLAVGRENIISVRRDDYGTSALVTDAKGMREAHPELVVDPATLDDIMVMVIRGEAP